MEDPTKIPKKGRGIQCCAPMANKLHQMQVFKLYVNNKDESYAIWLVIRNTIFDVEIPLKEKCNIECNKSYISQKQNCTPAKLLKV